MPLRGIERQYFPRWFKRAALGWYGSTSTATPPMAPLYIEPTAQPNGSSGIQAPLKGDIYFDGTNNTPYFYNGTAWVPIPGNQATTWTGLQTFGGGVSVPTGQTVAVADAGAFRANGVMVPIYELIQDLQNQVAAASYAVSHSILVADSLSGTYKVAAVTASFGTASTSGTLQVEVATGTQAIGAGVNQLTGTVSLAGTANTAVNGTVIGSPTTIAAGNRVNLIFGGTVTSLANCVVTVALQRLS